MLTASPEGVGRKRGGLARSVRSRIECFFSWRNSFCLLRGFSRSRRVAAACNFLFLNLFIF